MWRGGGVKKSSCRKMAGFSCSKKKVWYNIIIRQHHLYRRKRMKYIMIDTNIFLDMVIGRKSGVTDKVLGSFLLLLNNDKIKIVVPEIVRYETNKNVEKTLKEVGIKLQEAKKSVEALQCINVKNNYSHKQLAISVRKDKILKELNELREEFKKSEKNYLSAIKLTLEEIFEHRNCHIIPDDDFLRSICLQRRIFKKAPFHNNKKEEFGDGLIVATLIHLDKYLDSKDATEIIFVSGNTSDFADTTRKNFHETLVGDIPSFLIENGIQLNVKFINNFSNLINENLKKEVKEAGLEEEFRLLEEELQEEKARHDEEEIDFMDLMRSDYGLDTLSGIEETITAELIESEFVLGLIEFSENMVKFHQDKEELAEKYYDMKEKFQQQVAKKVFCLEKFCKVIKQETIGCHFDSIANWFDEKIAQFEISCDYGESKNDFIGVEKRNEELYFYDLDAFLGNTFMFYESNDAKIKLKIENKILSPSNGTSESIEVKLYSGDGILPGLITIDYGFVDEPIDEEIPDIREPRILIATKDIEEFFIRKQNELCEFIEKEKKKATKLETFLKNGH